MIELVNANSLHIPLKDKSVHMVCTSPPYFGLRRYDVNGEIGLEKSPAEYIEKLRAVFREVWRVLRDDGTLWLNLGDAYNGSGKGRGNGGVGPKSWKQLTNRGTRFESEQSINHSGFKPKDLFGIPWRVAFALQEQGWYLRSDIVWAKGNCMPESVTDRPTRSHEYIFLLSKQARYFYDMVAVSEPLQADSIRRNQSGWNGNEERDYINGPQNHMSRYLGSESAKSATTRNSRSVWTVSTQSYHGQHFATFPEKLVEPMILAGTSPKSCNKCGAPWKRQLEKKANGKVHPANDISGVGQGYDSVDGKEQSRSEWQEGVYYETVGWQPTCACPNNTGAGKCIVLDPFSGTGTVGRVCIKHKRSFVGLELKPEYIELAQERTSNAPVMLMENV